MSKENKTKKIFRVEKDKNFSVIKNTIFLDERLSWGAKGVLAYALTKPDDWDLYISEVVKRGTDKKEKVSRYFKELRQAGYFEYKRIYEKGKITRTEYIISEQAKHSNSINIISRYKAKKALEAEKLKPEILIQEKLGLEILSIEKTPLINTDYILNTDNNKVLKEEKEKLMLPLDEENKLSLMNLKTKFIETLKENGLTYNPGQKDARFNYFTIAENNMEPHDLIDLIPKLIQVKKENPNDKFFNGICWNMSDLISYKAKINNAYKSNIVTFPKYDMDELRKEGWR